MPSGCVPIFKSSKIPKHAKVLWTCGIISQVTYMASQKKVAVLKIILHNYTVSMFGPCHMCISFSAVSFIKNLPCMRKLQAGRITPPGESPGDRFPPAPTRFITLYGVVFRITCTLIVTCAVYVTSDYDVTCVTCVLEYIIMYVINAHYVSSQPVICQLVPCNAYCLLNRDTWHVGDRELVQSY